MPKPKIKKQHLHFLGIGGHAMRGVALAARELGHNVTGTDEGAYPPGSDWLDAQGFTWWQKADQAHLKGVDRVVISGHVQAKHPELVAALEERIPVVSFAELVGELTAAARRIVISGAHGKTTTTSLLTWIFESAGRTPDYLIGIKPHNFDTSVRLQGGDVAIIEGDEYRASQLDTRSKFDYYHPHILIVTSVEMDHPDFFRDIDDIKDRFRNLVADVPSDGRVIYWDGSQDVTDVIRVASQSEPYDMDSTATDWHPGESVEYSPDGLSFSVMHDETDHGTIQVPLYGRHNVLNTLAAVAVALGEGIEFSAIAEAMTSFKGASRRFERVSAPGAIVQVFDDYAHHPTEVKTTLEAAKLHFPGRVLAMYRPHTFSRIKKLLNDYAGAFDSADQAYVADIEGAREAYLPEVVSAEDVANIGGKQVEAITDRTALLERLVAEAKPGDTVLAMSVNGYEGFAEELATRLAEKFPT